MADLQLPTVTSRQMLRAMRKHKVKDEYLIRTNKDRTRWTFEIECTCERKCGQAQRDEAYENWCKHVIAQAVKETNEEEA